MWNTLIIQPISWLLRVLYDLTSSYGIAIILFTLLMKIVFLPFSMKGKKGMMAMQRFTPKLKELEAKYKNDKDKYNQEMQKLYQKEKVNPLSGCLWQLLPFPVLIALFDVVRRPLTNLMQLSAEQVDKIIAYPAITESLTKSGIDLTTAAAQHQIQIANAMHDNFAQLQASMPELATLMNIDFSFLGMNLSLTPVFSVINLYWILPVISGGIAFLSMYISQKMTGAPANDQQSQQTKMFMLMSPVMSIWFGYMWPAAMSVYWIANSLFSIIQDYWLTIHYRKVFARKDAENANKEAAEKEAAAQKKAEIAAKREANAQLNRSNTSQKKYKQLKTQMEPTRPKKADASDKTDESKGASSDE